MADKERTLKDRIQEAADSPVGRRIVRTAVIGSGADFNQRLTERVKQAWKGRKKQSRSRGR